MLALTRVKTTVSNKEITFCIIQQVSVDVYVELLRLLFLARLFTVNSSDSKATFTYMHSSKYI